ncbi:MAG TPA: hypothetical protein DCQ06_13805, partial [Myxococcales bacterium]|nr:hypothetical protein [Myxococcales bacterium]
MAKTQTGTAEAALGYFALTRSPKAAAAFTLPMLVIYGLGLLWQRTQGQGIALQNGVDLITIGLTEIFVSWDLAGDAPWLYLYTSLVVINLWLIRNVGLRLSEMRLWAGVIVPMMLECSAYAVITGVVSSSISMELLHFSEEAVESLHIALSVGSNGLTWSDVILISLGAGLHEELVFRLFGFGVGCRALISSRWRELLWREPSATVKVFVLGLLMAMLFSAAHGIVMPLSPA